MIGVDGLTDEVRRSDVAVVLGSKVNPDGTPSPRLAARLGRALDLYRGGWTRRIIVSGGTGVEGVPEGTAMKRWLVARGVPDHAIIVDDQGVDTRATARNAAVLMRTHDLHSAIVVSQYFHIPRTKLAFAQEGLPGVGSAHPDYFEPRDLYSLAREIPGYASYLRG
ncbi:MAG: YdcF family protein [Brevundimonas sp.]|nr:MAG: YdcF family protein [Brevundimonas sp.]